MLQQELDEATSLYRSNKLDEAEARFRMLHAQPTTRAAAAYGLGVIALSRKNPDEAFGWLAMVARDSPRFADARYYLSDIEQARGNDAEARRYCCECLNAQPAHVGGRKAMAKLDSDKKTPDGAPVASEPGRLEVRDPAKRSTGPTETELWLPHESEMEEYRQRRIQKERIDFAVEHWHGKPLVWRIYNVMGAVLVVGIFVFVGWMALRIFPPVLEGITAGKNAPPRASQSWCVSSFEMWKSNPAFYGDGLLGRIREQGCAYYKIPDEAVVAEVKARLRGSR